MASRRDSKLVVGDIHARIDPSRKSARDPRPYWRIIEDALAARGGTDGR